MPLILSIDVLKDFASQGSCHHLYAATDAQHGNLSVEGFAGKEKLLFVALRTNAMQLRQRLLAEKQRIDVAASGEDDAIELIEQRNESLLVVMRRDDNRRATGLEHGEVIALSQLAALVAEVASNADNTICHYTEVFLVFLESLKSLRSLKSLKSLESFYFRWVL